MISDETGRGRHKASGAELVRGETGTASPGGTGVTPEPCGAGEKGREAHTRQCDPHVFVLDKHGTPLQPCHPARARKLLARGRAVVHRHTPFVIRLRDRTIEESGADGVELGIDPGSRHTGIAVFTHQAGERRGRYAIQLDHPRPRGWLPPSLQHRVDTTTSWVDRLQQWAPMRAVHVERVAFDTHALAAGKPLEGAEYQQGTLHGYEVREYLLTKFGRACAYCGVMDTPLNIDHVQPRSRGGTDRVSNLVLACVPCNQVKADRSVEEFAPGAAERVLARAKTPLRDAAAANATRRALWKTLDERLPTRVGTGGRTKWNRTRNQLPKSHTLDALCVGKLDTVSQTIRAVLVAGCAGRGTYARTRPDKHGFPRLRLPRSKGVFGFATGDLVRAAVPKGKKAGTHTGRVAVRASGSFNITTAHGTVQGISHKHVRQLQRADGYAYTIQEEVGVSRPSRTGFSRPTHR